MNASEPLDRNDIEAALARVIQTNDVDLPLLPEVAGKVVQLAQNPDSGAAELAKLIEGDITLASHVMRIANSAAYSPNASIVSLQQAIARLGMKLISEIALAASVNTSLFQVPKYEKHVKDILHHSLACALWAKEVARLCRKNVEAAFISGLLHDIGRPVVVQSVCKIAKKQEASVSPDIMLALENKYQREMGERTVTEWKMPATIRETVTFFDKYQEPHGSRFQTMIAVAGKVIASHLTGVSPGETRLSLDQVKAHPIFAELNIYADEIETILASGEKVKQALEVMAV